MKSSAVVAWAIVCSGLCATTVARSANEPGATQALSPSPSAAASQSSLPPIPIADFVHGSQLELPRLSPDGRHLAIRVLRQVDGNDVRMMAVYDLAALKVVSLLRLPIYHFPLDFRWVSDTRLIVMMGRELGTLEAPSNTGEIIATDFDGANQDYLYGFERFSKSRRGRPDDNGWGTFEDVPTPRNGHFFMREESWDSTSPHSVLQDVDAGNGVRRQLADLPFDGLDFVIDHHGQVAYATGEDEKDHALVLRHVTDGDHWVRAEKEFAGLRPFGFGADDKVLYAMRAPDGGPASLVRVDAAGGEPLLLASDPVGAIDMLQFCASDEPLVVSTEVGVPRPQYVAAGAAVNLHRALSAQFPGEYVSLQSCSADGGRMVFFVHSDTDPGSYYLYDRDSAKAERLFDRQPAIDPRRMASRKPIGLTASDGQTLKGYLTLPPGRAPHDLPMVLLPHGGPHGVADDWFYDTDAQFLASRGYAVLQVNYRGSGGRGPRFQRAGYRQWGERIQADLSDGVRWAIAEHIADPARIGVYGGSFGGYSALMQPIRNPGLYRCVVGYAGVYDLPLMYEEGDIAQREPGKAYLGRVLGHDAASLRLNSPDQLAEQVKVPVLLVHGMDDQRAPFMHAERMRAALQKAGNAPQWLAVDHEGHGFFAEKNRFAFYEKLEAFLAQHLHPDQ